MAGAIRKTTIQIDWKINNEMLRRADEETDRIVRSADKMEGNFNQSAKAVDSATRAIHKQSGKIRESAAHANKLEGNFKGADGAAEKFGNTSKRAGEKTERSLNSAKGGVKNVQHEFDNLDKNVEGFAEKSKNRFNMLKGVIIGLGTGAVASLGKKVFELASDTNESINKVDVAFKDNADGVKAWSKTTLDNIGLAQGTALDLAATYGDMSTSMGLSTSEAEKMSTGMVNLAGDLASFKNIGIDRANTALNGVFTGETEALKSLGIVMTQTNLEQFALETGAVKATKSGVDATKQAIAREKAQKKLNEAIKKHGKNSLEARDARSKLQQIEEKSHETAKVNLKDMKQDELVRLRYNYVMSKTKNAHHDFKNTSDQAANASRVFSESLKELGSNAGQYLLPLFTPLITKAGNFVKKMSDIPSVVKGLKEDYKPAFDLMHDVGDFFTDDLIPSAKEFASTFGPGFIDGGIKTLEAAGTVMKTVVLPPLKTITDFAKDNPTGMKRVGKFAGIAVTAFGGFKLAKFLIDKTVESADRLTNSLKRIGPAAATSAAETSASAKAIDMSDNYVSQTRTGKSKKGFSLFKTAETVVDDTSRVSRNAGKIGLLSKARAGLGKVGSVGKLAKGAGIIGVGISALDLLTMTKHTAGSKIGNFGGSLAGGAGGAAIGTMIAPGIGTAIGGAIGAFAGSSLGKKLGGYLQKEGPKIAKKLKAGWGDVSKFAEKHPILGFQVNAANKGLEAIQKSWKAVKGGAKDAWSEAKNFFEDPLKIDAGGKGVSKSSAKAVNKYLGAEQKLSDSHTRIFTEGRPMTKGELNANIKTIDSMIEPAKKSIDKKSAKSQKDWDTLNKLGIATDERTASGKKDSKESADYKKSQLEASNKALKQNEKDFYRDQQTSVKNEEAKINEIKNRARKENRKLTKQEEDEIKRIQDDGKQYRKSSEERYSKERKVEEAAQRRNAVEGLSKSAKEQKIIMGNLESAKSKMSAKSAAKVVKSSAKARDGAIKEAKKEYNQTKKILDEKRFVTGEISDKEYKELLKKAKKKRAGQIEEAEKAHKGVVKEAKKQAKGHLNEVDWETGETLSKWDQFKNGFSDTVGKITSWAGDKWSAFSGSIVTFTSTATATAAGLWATFKTNIFKLINDALTGVNKVLSFFGIELIPLIGGGSIPQSQEDKLSAKDKKKYHSTSQSGVRAMRFTGSDNASGEIMAGEEGFEIAYNKNSAKARILGANGPEITQVESGTKILNHQESKKMMSGGLGAGIVLPGFSKGNTSFADAAKDFAVSAVDKVKDVGSAAFQFATNPVAGIKKLLAKRSGLDNHSGAGKMANGVVDYFGNKAGSWLKNKLSDVAGFGAGPAGPSGKGAQAWAPIIRQAAIAMKENVSASEIAGIVAQIHRESGGNQRIIQSSAVVDVNTLSGNPAQGLLQYIPQTFKAYAMKGHSNILSGYDQLLAFFNNSSWRRDLPYGKRGWGPRGKRRFARGGRPPTGEEVLVGEEGPELFTTDSPGIIHTAEKTKDILHRKNGTTINFNPTINITVEDGGTADESKLKKIIQEQLDAMYDKLTRTYGPQGGHA